MEMALSGLPQTISENKVLFFPIFTVFSAGVTLAAADISLINYRF